MLFLTRENPFPPVDAGRMREANLVTATAYCHGNDTSDFITAARSDRQRPAGLRDRPDKVVCKTTGKNATKTGVQNVSNLV